MLTIHHEGSFETGARAPAWLGRPQAAVANTIIAPGIAVATKALADQDWEDREWLANASEREFPHRRRASIASTRNSPVQRLAAFLAAASRLNEYEGRDPDLISDLLPCGVVADMLGLDVEALAHALVGLKERDLISHCANGWLRLPDRGRLERFIPSAELAHSAARD